jgi:hypothetical protein
MPFSTKTLAEYSGYRGALVEYWVNILMFGVILYLSWAYATRAALLKDDISKEVTAAICRCDRQKSHGHAEDAVAESSEAFHPLTGNAIVRTEHHCSGRAIAEPG